LKNLKLLRDNKGVSQRKVAAAIGSNQQSVHRYENGNYEPDIQTLMLLADYFDTTIDFLVGRTEINQKIALVDKYSLNGQESEVMDKFRDLSVAHQTCFCSMLEALVVLANNDSE
jgi:transcriptional regulator with XRE-family HTH domain